MQGVAQRKLGERLLRSNVVGGYPKLDEIERQHHSAGESCVHAVIDCWLQGDGKDKEPSWRALIWRLDKENETSAAADSIRHYAEPLPGKSCDSITFLYSI